MRIHCLQHVPFEGPGIIEAWVKSKGYQITCTKFFENDYLPGLEEIDWLVIMGGPMSIYDEELYPWLVKEKAFIKSAIDNSKTVIGICLGAQLIANVLGAKVYKNNMKEVGWYPVEKVRTKENNILSGLSEKFMAFHWHGETYTLPKGAVHFARSKACENQAFLYKNNVLGLQFHLEMDYNGIELLIDNCKDELVRGKFIQSAEEILLAGKDKIGVANLLMKNILEYLSFIK